MERGDVDAGGARPWCSADCRDGEISLGSVGWCVHDLGDEGVERANQRGGSVFGDRAAWSRTCALWIFAVPHVCAGAGLGSLDERRFCVLVLSRLWIANYSDGMLIKHHVQDPEGCPLEERTFGRGQLYFPCRVFLISFRLFQF